MAETWLGALACADGSQMCSGKRPAFNPNPTSANQNNGASPAWSRKGPSSQLPVRAAIPDILLLIAGEGPALEHCRRLAAELELTANVQFAGYLDRRRELLDCYRAGNLFVFASRTETQGLVLLEAMAQGVPVVSTAHMGTIDILGPGRGCVVAEEREHQFAAEVIRLMQDALLRKRLGRDAQAYAATWSSREQAARLLQLYR